MEIQTPTLAQWWLQYAPEYHRRAWSDYRHLLAEVVRYGLEPPLLDIGCGYGFLVECARRFGLKAYGIEASEWALQQAKDRHPLADVRSWRAGYDLPFADGSIGIAMLNQVVDHLTLAENDHLFRELHRVLSRSGVLIAHSPSRFNRADIDNGHVTFFSPSEFASFVCQFGFRITEQPYYPRPLLGRGRASLPLRVATRFWRPEFLAATIDVVAAKSV